MAVKQLSVFLENREGRVESVFNLLKEAGVNVVSVSLADTKEFGVLRMIVDDSDKAQEALVSHEISSKVIPVNAVRISHEVGSLSAALNAIADAGINISYMYGLSTGQSGASIALKTNDVPKTDEVLKDIGIELYTDETIAKNIG